ncbi:MAG: sigma-E factor negative regulatory protein [Polaromonas sp.]|nr:sigma-E factor negative regulatory protein [Polaromonas sp.]
MSQSKFSVHPESADPLPVNRMTPSPSTRESLSALVDDELGDEELAALLEACQQDEAALGCWNRYQLIGEALRAPMAVAAGGALGAELAFASRLSQRLAQEVVAPSVPATAQPFRPAPLPHAALALAAELPQYRAAAANDGIFRWKLVAGVACLAAVSALAWNVSGLLGPTSGAQLAQAPSAAQVLVASPQGVVVRDARLEELLAAHRQFGATSALQEPSGFLRNAAFDMPQAAVAGR